MNDRIIQFICDPITSSDAISMTKAASELTLKEGPVITGMLPFVMVDVEEGLPIAKQCGFAKP